MILFDIASLPKGVDINVWYSLYEKGLCIYDSIEPGLQPQKIDDTGIAFIDIRNVSTDDRVSLNNAINAINDEKHDEMEKSNDIVKENNRQLIEYLRNINKL